MSPSLSSDDDLDTKSPVKEAYDQKEVDTSVLPEGNKDFHEIPPVDPEVEKKILRKFDIYLLFLLATMYLCNALDKTNLGNAKTDGFDKDIGLVGNQYYQLITAFYAPFCVAGTPITILIKKFTAARVLPIMAFAFGGLSMISAAVKNFGGILTIRLLLAVAEAAVLPGTIFYLSTFYTRAELARRVGIFYAAASIAGAFGGLIAYGVFQAKHAALQGWQILFLTEGAFTITVAILLALILPKSPAHAKFLNAEEKAACEARLLRDGTTAVKTDTTVKQAFKAILTEWQTIMWFGIEFCLGVPLASVSNFLPQVVARLGYSTVKTNLYTVAPNIVGAVCLVIFTQSSDRFRERSIHLILPLSLTLIGFIVLGTIDVEAHINVSYFACFLLCMGSFTPSVLLCSWAANNTPDPTKRAVLVAITVGFGNAAGLVSSNVFQAKDEPKYIPALVCSAVFGAAAITGVALFGSYMRIDNWRRDKKQGVRLTSKDVDTAKLLNGHHDLNWRWFY